MLISFEYSSIMKLVPPQSAGILIVLYSIASGVMNQPKENRRLRCALGRYNGSLGGRKCPNKVIDKLTKKWFQS